MHFVDDDCSVDNNIYIVHIINQHMVYPMGKVLCNKN